MKPSLVFWLVATCLFSVIALADGTAGDAQAKKLLKTAMDKSYMAGDFDVAVGKLNQADALCKMRGCSPSLRAEIYGSLAIVHWVGLEDNDSALQDLRAMVKSDPKFELGDTYAPPELLQALDGVRAEGRRSAAGAGAPVASGAAPPKIAPPAGPPPAVPPPAVAQAPRSAAPDAGAAPKTPEEARKQEEFRQQVEARKAQRAHEIEQAGRIAEEEAARRAVEEKRAEEARKVAEAKKAEEDKKEAARKAAEEKRAEEQRKIEEERKAAEEKKEAARKAAEEKKEAERKAAEEKKEAERKAAEDKKEAARKAAEEKKEAARKAAEDKKEAARKAAEDKKEAARKAAEEAAKKAEEERLAKEDQRLRTPPPVGKLQETPWREQTMGYPIPIYVKVPPPPRGVERPRVEVVKVVTEYWAPGVAVPQQVELKPLPNGGYGGHLPCEASDQEGEMTYFTTAINKYDNPVAGSGTRAKPNKVQVKSVFTGSFPHLPGELPPRVCTEERKEAERKAKEAASAKDVALVKEGAAVQETSAPPAAAPTPPTTKPRGGACAGCRLGSGGEGAFGSAALAIAALGLHRLRRRRR